MAFTAFMRLLDKISIVTRSGFWFEDIKSAHLWSTPNSWVWTLDVTLNPGNFGTWTPINHFWLLLSIITVPASKMGLQYRFNIFPLYRSWFVVFFQVYYCSRTHSQLTQFIKEIQKSSFNNAAADGTDEARKNSTQPDTSAMYFTEFFVTVAALASRQGLCINDSVRRLPTVQQMNDRCLDLQKSNEETKTGTLPIHQSFLSQRRHWNPPRINRLSETCFSHGCHDLSHDSNRVAIFHWLYLTWVTLCVDSTKS